MASIVRALARPLVIVGQPRQIHLLRGYVVATLALIRGLCELARRLGRRRIGRKEALDA